MAPITSLGYWLAPIARYEVITKKLEPKVSSRAFVSRRQFERRLLAEGEIHGCDKSLFEIVKRTILAPSSNLSRGLRALSRFSNSLASVFSSLWIPERRDSRSHDSRVIA
jgi:hypothetical protein